VRDFSAQERFAAAGLAREDLYFFSRWTFQQRKRYLWQRAGHHRLICDALMRVYRGECRRLIINIPPRYSKTELAVVNFIAWCMGQVPDSEFIHVSYSGELAQSNSSNVLQVMRHEAYREIFPAVELASDAKHHWRTTSGGVLYTAGVGGTLTGFGAGKEREGFGGAIIVDDPHKADEARSDTIRKNVLEWFQNTLESRKNSPARTPLILIMQRLHAEDLAGWLLDGGNGEQWEHLCLPALQPDGTALWPEKHQVEDLRRMETAAPYTFAGQYQQRPSPGEGGVFKPAQLQVVDAVPAGSIRWVRAWDLGSTVDGDPSAGALLGKMPDGRYVIGDMEVMLAGPDERDRSILNTAARDGRPVRIGIPQDPGQAGKTQVLYLTRQLAGYTVRSSPESGDKVTRAEPFAAQVNVGNVLMVRGKWNKPLIEQMRDFPNGKHDDQIDALSRAFADLLAAARAGVVSELGL
jgi:predicted phage terminase large subunit-like protein